MWRFWYADVSFFFDVAVCIYLYIVIFAIFDIPDGSAVYYLLILLFDSIGSIACAASFLELVGEAENDR